MSLKNKDKPVRHHLQMVLFPPVTSRMIPICRKAIEMVKAGRGDEIIEVKLSGRSQILKVTSAIEFVREMRLEPFCEDFQNSKNEPSPGLIIQKIPGDQSSKIPVKTGLAGRIAAKKIGMKSSGTS